MHRKQQDSAMISRLFFRLLPVQVAMVAMGSINSIVDGVIAARFIDASTMGVVGLYYTVMRILEASGAILLGGVSVLSGRYLGSGKVDQTRGICTLGMTLALIIGAMVTVASFAAPVAIARLLGANDILLKPLATYIRGYAIGIIPQLLGQQIAATLQLERKEKLGHLAISVMITVNVALDIVFVAVMDLGVRGLALATSLANWAYFIVVAQYYFTPKAQLKPKLSLVEFRETLTVLKIGFPNALLVVCLAARSLVINRILLRWVGNNGLSAMSSYNMVCGLLISIALGTGSLVRMLSSVFLGEENRDGLLDLMRICLTKVLAIMTAVGAAVVLLAPVLASVFFPDPRTSVYQMTKELFFIYGFCVPFTLVCLVYSSYFQAAGHRLFVNLISVMDGFVSMVVPAALLAPKLGSTGVWLSFPIGLLITLAVSALYPVIRLRHLPRGLEEWLLLPPEFGRGDVLVLHLRSMEEITQTSERVQEFCDSVGLHHKTGAIAGLCLEEIAGNIVQHGFPADRKKHLIEVRVGIPEGGIVLRIKDDCIPFDPHEWARITSPEDPAANIGIRLVYAIAEEVNYQNLLGLNVLTIRVSDDAFSPEAA